LAAAAFQSQGKLFFSRYDIVRTLGAELTGSFADFFVTFLQIPFSA
jgi:hypothetical protein